MHCLAIDFHNPVGVVKVGIKLISFPILKNRGFRIRIIFEIFLEIGPN